MTFIQGCSHFCREHFFLALFDSFLPFELDDKLSDQFSGFLGANFSIVIIFASANPVSKYIEENLQQILKPILETRVFIISEKSWDKF